MPVFSFFLFSHVTIPGSEAYSLQEDRKVKRKGTVIAVILMLAGCGGQEEKTVKEQNAEGHYYTEEEARQYLSENRGVRPAETQELISEDGYFCILTDLEKEENEFITVGGTAQLEARWSWGSSAWEISAEENPEYVWNLDGSWYADVGAYEVYITFEGCDGNNVNLTAEAVFEKADGSGKGTYGEQQQTVNLTLKNTSVYDVYGECGIYGGYPSFGLTVEKDRLILYYGFDGTETVMTR